MDTGTGSVSKASHTNYSFPRATSGLRRKHDSSASLKIRGRLSGAGSKVEEKDAAVHGPPSKNLHGTRVFAAF